ncbi:Sec translocon accessory complex subunit YajC [Vibrio stylophorae]|uniref:Sec translocon accessory complex subunit YajC n=1 Tax=Vibrio stylophorae TaxID=659351 RepID=A0ABM8ZRB6_9VIBR|nr:preprotein translocase subunit YajC [Vibrio stylophorae]CAH0532846.1 Sec translocon accessory complex subunit YajC [Vibrio stylophorae]
MSLISTAHAAGEAGAQQGGGFSLIFMLVMFAAIFYFMIFRPQNKRVKEHRNLMSSMGKGDEVLTNGGLVGKITKISEESDFIVIALNDSNQVTIKKDFVTAVLPKGTIQSL